MDVSCHRLFLPGTSLELAAIIIIIIIIIIFIIIIIIIILHKISKND